MRTRSLLALTALGGAAALFFLWARRAKRLKRHAQLSAAAEPPAPAAEPKTKLERKPSLPWSQRRQARADLARAESPPSAAVPAATEEPPPPPQVAIAADAPDTSRPRPPRPSSKPQVQRGRSRPSGLLTVDERKVLQMAPFSPCLAQWELTHLSPDELKRPSAREFDAALLFVDISGFTNLCTRLDIDALQHHINSYFGVLIDVVTSYGGDVLRFAGDALYCAWSLHTGAEGAGTLELATRAACRCALELTDRCGTYQISEGEVSARAFATLPTTHTTHPTPTLVLDTGQRRALYTRGVRRRHPDGLPCWYPG